MGGVTVGFCYRNGQFKLIKYPDTGQTIPHGINDNGLIVGLFHQLTGPLNGQIGPFLFVQGQFQRLKFPGSNGLIVAHGINISGQIVGVYIKDTVAHGFLIAPSQ
jgi:hypothetical protein